MHKQHGFGKWRFMIAEYVGFGLDKWHNEITILRLGFIQIGRINH